MPAPHQNQLIMRHLVRILPILATAMLACLTARAQDSTTPTESQSAHTDSVLFVIPSDTNLSVARVDKDYTLGHFTWGLDAGSAMDLSANDMSSINIHAYFGYKGHWMRFIGVGAGINTMISNSSRCYPVYAMMRTSFSSKPQLCFLDLRAGISFNSIYDRSSQTDLYGSIGLGITLAYGRKFSSYIILSYDYMPMRATTLFRTVEEEAPLPGEIFEGEEQTTTTTTNLVPYRSKFPNLHFAGIRIGCSF